jgi:hypothetical protein
MIIVNEIIQFELIPEKAPRITKKASRYDPIIDQFLDKDVESVRVNTKDMESRKLAIALRSRVRARNMMNAIQVTQRGNDVYLVKTMK